MYPDVQETQEIGFVAHNFNLSTKISVSLRPPHLHMKFWASQNYLILLCLNNNK